MTQDISIDLLKKLQREFKKKLKTSGIAQKKYLNYHDSNQFAIKVGELLSEVFQENLSSNQLPNGRMYYNIARKVVDPMMNQNYQLVSENSSRVQEILNKQAGLHIKAQKPELNQDRIDGIVQRLADSEQFDDIKWILNEPIINFTQSVVDDAIKANADFQYEAGLKPKIIRTANAGCCEWCSRVVGEYEYSRNMPKDVFRRHRNCRCEVNYHPGDGKKQDVWTKEWRKVDEDDKIRDRIVINDNHKVSSGAKNYHRDESKDKFFDPDYVRKDKHAYLMYDEIKNSNQALSKRKIYNNIKQFSSMKNFSKDDVDIAFNHVFNISHNLEDGKTLFQPDYDMAQSWSRLINNQNISENDLILLKHERLEHDLMYKQGMSYEDAHRETNKKYKYKSGDE